MWDLITNESGLKFILLLIAFIIFYSYNSWWTSNSNTMNSEEKKQKQNRIKELQDLIQKKELQIENMVLKHEEIFQEIKDLEIESSMDFEKEEKNNLKIKKLELKLKHIEMKTATMIEDKVMLIDELNKLLW